MKEKPHNKKIYKYCCADKKKLKYDIIGKMIGVFSIAFILVCIGIIPASKILNSPSDIKEYDVYKYILLPIGFMLPIACILFFFFLSYLLYKLICSEYYLLDTSLEYDEKQIGIMCRKGKYYISINDVICINDNKTSLSIAWTSNQKCFVFSFGWLGKTSARELGELLSKHEQYTNNTKDYQLILKKHRIKKFSLGRHVFQFHLHKLAKGKDI